MALYALVLVIILIVLDFIPIKKAINIDSDDLTKYKNNESQKLYIVDYVQVTDSIWEVIGDEKGVRKLQDGVVMYLAEPLQGKDPLKELNYAFQKVYEPQAQNGFVFIGKEVRTIVEGGNNGDPKDLMVHFQIDDWRIIYPIRRDSIRDIYAPKSYLTVYDFIKLLF